MLQQERTKALNKTLRKQRTRVSIKTKSNLPRLSVFRSLKHFYAQIIDDTQGKTLCAASDKEISGKGMKAVEIAAEVGKLLGKKAVEKKISNVVFDRGHYKYHGQVKAAADGAREGGLKF